MSTSEGRPGARVKDVRSTEDVLVVDLLDGRTISVPLVWYPRLLSATPEQRANWRIAGGGFGIYWPDIDQDLVVVPGWISNIDVFWEEPRVARFFERLASFSRLILFDKRGTGLSDRVTDMPNLETRMDDVRAVMDAVSSTQAALFGYSEGGPMCALFAATYPERTTALIMGGSYPRRMWAPD